MPAVASADSKDRGTAVRDALKSYLALAGGATEVTRRKALEAARALVAAKKAAAKKSPAKKSPAASAGT